MPSINFTDYLEDHSDHIFNFRNVTEYEVSKAIEKLKTNVSTGIDKVSANFLKKLEPEILTKITVIWKNVFKIHFHGILVTYIT